MGTANRRGFTLIEMMIVVVIIGVLASIAIPAFKRYIRRSKTTEASMNVRRLYDGSVSYYELGNPSRTGAPIPRSFPTSTARTPSSHACGLEADKIQPSDAHWKGATWQALTFAIDDPFYYIYSYDSAGTETAASFTARAEGDLNCDSLFSVYERVGNVDAARNVRGGSGLYKYLPLD